MKKITIVVPQVFELTKKELETLQKISATNFAEFRDAEYLSLAKFKKSKEYSKTRNEDWFKRRNFCDLKDVFKLSDYNLIDTLGEAWHLTYVMTDLGAKVLEEYKKEKS